MYQYLCINIYVSIFMYQIYIIYVSINLYNLCINNINNVSIIKTFTMMHGQPDIKTT
jgi:hypothetical protein